MHHNKAGSRRTGGARKPLAGIVPGPSAPEANPLSSEAESRFADVAALSADWIWETDIVGRYVYSSARVSDILGYTADEVVGKTLFDLMPEDEATRLREVLGELIVAQRPIENLVHQKLRKDGRTVCLQTQARPVFAADGGLMGYRGVDRDITAQRQTEEAQRQLREHESFLRQVVDINPNFVFVRDREGRFILANQAIADAYGVTVEQLIGKTDADFKLGGADVEEIRRGDLAVMESLEEKFIPESLIAYGGAQPRWVQTIKRPLIDDDGVARRVLGVSSDITERKLMQQAIEASLERRGRQVQTSTEIAQEIAGVMALDELFRRVVKLVKERFGYYHAQIFRYDATTNVMRLVVGYGETGAAMLKAEHHLPMGRGVVGTAAETGHLVMASDVSKDPDWIPNRFLPKTQGELAVPIKWRDQILGILDVQSETAGALTGEDQLLLEGLCGQIAMAMESTQLLEFANAFRQVIEASGQGIGWATLDGTIVYANPMLCRMAGVPDPSDLVGRPSLEFYPPEIYQQMRDEILPEVLRVGQWQGELSMLGPGGHVIHTLENLFVIRDKEGNPIYLANQIADISALRQAEVSLQQSELRYRVLFEQANDAIILENESERILDVNQRACEMFGYTREELLSMKTSDLQPPSSSSLPIYSDPDMPTNIFELRASKRDGSTIYIEVHISPLEIGGQPLFLSIVRDITERRLTERALEQERYLLNALMENTPDHIYFKDIENRFVRINRSMMEWLHLNAPEEAVGKTDFDFFSEEHAQQAFNDDRTLMQTGQALIGLEEKETWPDGRVTWVSTTKLPMYDPQGAVSGTFGISRDITESRLAQEQLRETQRLLQGILDNTAVVIYIKDLQGRYLLVNRRYEILFDVNQADIIGKTYEEIFPNSASNGLGVETEVVLSGGQSLEQIESVRREGGVQTYLSLKFPLCADDGAPYAVGCISTDITERESAEAERKRLLDDLESHATQLEVTLEDTAALYRASQAINTSSMPDEVAYALIVGLNLPEVHRITLNLFDYPWTPEHAPEQIETVAVWDARVASGDIQPTPSGQRVELRRYPAAHLFTPDAPLVFHDILTDSRLDEFSRALFRDVFRAHCVAFLPLITSGQCIGFVNILSRSETEFDERRLQRLTALSSQAATAIQNMRLLKLAQDRARRERALREIALTVGASESISGLLAELPLIIAPLRQLVPVDFLTVATYTPGETELTLFAIPIGAHTGRFTQGMRLPLEGTSTSWVITHGEPWLDSDIRSTPAFPQDRRLVDEGVVARVVLPLRFGDEVVGTLIIGCQRVGAYTQEDLATLQRVADQLAQALERTRLLETTRAARDEVTAVHRSYLRQGWQEYLEKEQLLSQSTFVYNGGKVEVNPDFARPEIEHSLKTGEMVTHAMLSPQSADSKRTALTVPIEVRGQVLGVLGLEDPQGNWHWTPEQLMLIQAVAQQLGQVLENARLIEATQNQAERERLVDEVSSRVRASLELDTVLRTAVAELRDALQLAEIEVRIDAEAMSQRGRA
ncbi:MAG: PAS domain S-box protein [Anaerolineae bacterium]|nr:PAS domain S-box protein [Anaerolineae bacterium]